MPQRTDDTKPVYGPSKLPELAKLFRTMQTVSKAIFEKTQRGTLPVPSEPVDLTTLNTPPGRPKRSKQPPKVTTP